MTSHRTTASDFLYFKKRCIYWQEFWGLADIRIVISHEKSDGDGHAWVNRNQIENAAVAICLEKEPNGAFTREDLDLFAFHEVCHVVLAKYYELAARRCSNEDSIITEEEHIVRRLENCVFPLAKPKKKR